LLIDVEEVDLKLLRIIDKNSIRGLFDEKVMIYDQNDREIYNTTENDTTSVPHALLREVRQKKQVRFHPGKKEGVGLLFAEKENQFVVIASAYDQYGRSKLNYLKWLLVIGFLVSIGLTVFTGRIYARNSLQPMSDIVKQVDKITFESLHMRVNEGNKTDEIARLSITFNRMLERLESAFEMQSSFVSNASHELRTPLTSVTGQIEVALMKPRTNEEYKTVLESVLEDIRNLNELSNGLLDLAKASSDASSLAMQPLRIDEILWETRADLIKRKNEYAITIHFSEPIDDEKELTVFGNLHLLKTAILNLMDNGCKFSSGKSVEVWLAVKNGNILLKFMDQGIGIDREDVDSVLHPFYRAKNAKTIHGSGLGLTLTEKIIHLHKGTLTIDSAIGKGTVITINLPVTS
jgi:two-component system, OmpR family, sensor histidine kinase ArlS